MRMSVTTTSGWCSSTAPAHQKIVVGQQDADRHVRPAYAISGASPFAESQAAASAVGPKSALAR
jgi:hypothetical protein